MRPLAAAGSPLALLGALLGALLCALAAPRAAHAQTVDVAARVVKHAGGATPIALPAAEMPDASAVAIKTLVVGAPRKIAHVRVPSKTRDGIAWEALIADPDGATQVLWSGVTGYARGVEGERTGEALQIVDDATGVSHVLVGEIREDLRICGQAETLLAPRGLDPHAMTLRGASVQRLTREQRAGALRVVASPHGGPADPPLAPLLTTSGASTAIGSPAALTDGDPATTWSEARPGDGHGEFVVMRAPSDVPLTRLAITIAPATPKAGGAAPRTLYLVTDTQTLQIELPNDAWMHPGEAYDVPLVDPLHASCVALVLDDAYAHGNAHPEVTLAEVVAYSAFDAPSAKLAEVAAALAGGGARANAAAAILKRAGAPALAAVMASYDKLDEAGRALAIDVAASAEDCGASTPILLEAMNDRDREVRRKGTEKLQRCGKSAIVGLVAGVRGERPLARASAAPLLAAMAPSDALDPLSEVMGQGPPPVRAAVRSAFARAARSAKKEKLAILVSDPSRAADARLDLLRGLGESIVQVAPHADAAIADLLHSDLRDPPEPPMRTRYLIAGPLAVLARSGDARALAQLISLLARDKDAAVRAHAAEEATRITAIEVPLIRALGDGDPRVREAAIRALSGARSPDAAGAIAARLASDEWTFVRASAAASLGAAPASPAADGALATALKDASPRVRDAAISALAAHGARSAAPAIRAHLDDAGESLEVRVSAARALGALCDRASSDLLTTLARRAGLPLATESETQIGLGSIESLGALHPADLASRLAPLRDPAARAEARRAAEAAIAATPTCK